MSTRTTAASLVALVALASTCASGSYARDPLEEYDYSDMTLLKVIPSEGSAGAACFFASHDYAVGGIYVWAHLGAHVGNRYGTLVAILTDGVRIDQTQAVNGKDWVQIDFFWPLASAEAAGKLAGGCGNGPGR